MEKGFTITTIVAYSSDNIIEVVNYQTANCVFNVGWFNRSPVDGAKDSNTVGIWKIKNLK